MSAYRRVYDSRHMLADCQEPDQLRNPTVVNRVWATFTFSVQVYGIDGRIPASLNVSTLIITYA